MVEIQRTACLKLAPTPEQGAMLDDTIHTYYAALNFISIAAHEMNNCRNYVRLQKAVYHDVRRHFSIPSQMTISAIRQVASAYTSMKSNGNDKGIATFGPRGGVMLQGGERGRDFRIIPEKGVVSISTVSGRQKIAFDYGKQQYQYFDWTPGSATLIKRKGTFYLHVVFKVEIETPSLDNAYSVIGVDVGMNFLAVASGPDGKAIFIGGGAIKQRKHHYGRVRAGLQAKGTKSAKRTLKHLSGKESRFMRDVNHVVSKRIVEFAAQYDNPVIVLEALKGIRDSAKQRKNQRADFHSWAFYQLQGFIEYKALAKGIPVVKVDPRNTSKACSRCGAVGKRDRHNFTCACGYHNHSDYNASRNIALRFVVQRQVELDADEAQSTASEVASEIAKANSGNCAIVRG